MERPPHPPAPESGRPTPRGTLHLLNGDTTREKLERAGVAGTLAVWADVLHDGPVPGPSADPDRGRQVRARYLAEAGYTSYDEALRTLRRWDVALERFRDHEEVVIWCEHDLFDQLLLIRHLHWLEGRERGETRLSMVCIGEYPGVPDFMGLGQLEPAQLGALLELREPITPAQLELGRAAWEAFTSDDPARLAWLLKGDTSPLPFLARALRRHLQEFPSARNGLSRTEEQVLRVLAEAPVALRDLFRAVHREEDAFYIGDTSFRGVLERLAGGPRPALELDPGEAGGATPLEGAARITPTGRALLEGREDWLRLCRADRWLGGVHLDGARAAEWRRVAERPSVEGGLPAS